MATDATGVDTTVTTTRAETPPELAAICAVPTALPVMTPPELIVTVFVSALDQNTVAPVIGLPLAAVTCA
jgi:small neutral amino acid transporter SnatA (MarC family)